MVMSARGCMVLVAMPVPRISLSAVDINRDEPSLMWHVPPTAPAHVQCVQVTPLCA